MNSPCLVSGLRVLFLGFLVFQSPALAIYDPVMVKDCTLTPVDSEAADLVRVGDLVYFAADDGVHGKELWVTDGTPEGTVLVKDIFPGAESSLTVNRRNSRSYFAFGDVLIFGASDGMDGFELWRTDGTEAGTFLLKDLNPTDDSFPYGMCLSNGLLFFTAIHETKGRELWLTDGTAAGTRLVKDIHPTGSSEPVELFDYMDTLYFAANNGSDGAELWKSDGSEEGTEMVMDINPGGNGNPREMALFSGKIFFQADDGVNGRELWSTDGTEANTEMFLDIHFTGSSNPSNLAEVNGLLYFSAADTTTGAEPWVSNGLPNWGSDTRRFAAPGSPWPSTPAEFTEFEGRVYFTARGVSGTGTVWTSNVLRADGSPQSVKHVGSPKLPAELFLWDDKLVFVGDDIWISDGTAEGSVAALSNYPDKPVGVTGEAVELNGRFITVGYDDAHGFEVWSYDPAGAGPELIKDVHGGTTGSRFVPDSGHLQFAEIDGIGYFVAATDLDGGPANYGAELWRSDGSAAGTYMIKDINPGEDSSNPLDFTVVGNLLFFTADDGTHERELWRSDGTAEGTLLLQDITSANPYYTEFGQFAAVGETLFFAAENWSDHNMLWKSDGTIEGTVLVKKFDPTLRSLYIADMVAFDGRLFLAAMVDNNRELWTSDGTAEGTQLFKDFNPTRSSHPSALTVSGDRLYLLASTEDGLQMWVCDGTIEGTTMLLDPDPSGTGGSVGNLMPAKGRLYFIADDDEHGRELWVTRGTPASTHMVRDINPGEQSTTFGLMAVSEHILYFRAEEGRSNPDGEPGYTGRELWRSDGTEAGTWLVSDVIPNTGTERYASVEQITIVHDRVYFVVDDGVHGSEIWTSDGTDAGTRLAIDLYPGPPNSNTRILGSVDGKATAPKILLFSGDDYYHGNELWKINGPLDPIVVGAVGTEAGKITITFETEKDKTYRVGRSADLSAWVPASTVSDSEGMAEFTDEGATSGKRYFYRVEEVEEP